MILFNRFKLTRGRIIIGIIILVIIAAFLAFRNISNSRKQVQITSQINKGVVEENLILSGTILADEHVNLQFQASGLLTYVGVKEGDVVKKGKVIASLDARSIKKNLEKYLNTYVKTRNTFDQTTDDKLPNTSPDEKERERIARVLSNVQLDLNNSVLDVELTDIAMRLSSITTPIGGIVTQVTEQFPGVNINATTAKFEVVNPNTEYFEVTADQTDVVNVKEGQSVNIVLDSFENTSYTGKVEYISFAPLQSESGSVYKIKVKLDNQNSLVEGVRLGMTGDAKFLQNKKENVLYVSNNFINTDELGKYIKVGSPSNKVYIQTGLEGDENTEIMGNINEGDKVFE